MNQPAAYEKLRLAIREFSQPPEHPALTHMIEELQDKYGEQLTAILFYGSCLRSGDPYDGLVDLYLIVDRYTDIYHSRLKAFGNWILPPNVFYAEFPYQQKTVRCKYAVISAAHLLRGTSRWFHSYLWGRFSQPTAIAWCRDLAARELVEQGLAQSVVTFLDRAAPGLAGEGTFLSLWTQGLQLSYRTELRTETPGRAEQLVNSNRDYYREITRQAAPLLRIPFETSGSDGYRTRITRAAGWRNRVGWGIRSLQGKLLSVARLLKAFFTFEGGLDYIAWKLERHSGQKVEIPDRVRRYPLIFVWELFWRLYRRGIFR